MAANGKSAQTRRRLVLAAWALTLALVLMPLVLLMLHSAGRGFDWPLTVAANSATQSQ